MRAALPTPIIRRPQSSAISARWCEIPFSHPLSWGILSPHATSAPHKTAQTVCAFLRAPCRFFGFLRGGIFSAEQQSGIPAPRTHRARAGNPRRMRAARHTRALPVAHSHVHGRIPLELGKLQRLRFELEAVRRIRRIGKRLRNNRLGRVVDPRADEQKRSTSLENILHDRNPRCPHPRKPRTLRFNHTKPVCDRTMSPPILGRDPPQKTPRHGRERSQCVVPVKNEMALRLAKGERTQRHLVAAEWALGRSGA